MLLDADDWIKRGLLAAGTLLVVGAIGATTWYNLRLKDEFVEGKTETNYLRQETSRLGANTDNLRDEMFDKTKELKQTILVTKEDTVTLNKEIKSVQDDSNKSKAELKGDIQKLLAMNAQLQEQLKLKEQEFKAQLAERDERLQHELSKLKDMNVVFSAMHRQRDKEIEELSLKINREIEWRNKYHWNR